MTTIIRTIVGLAIAALVLAACGDDEADTTADGGTAAADEADATAADDGTFPITVATASGDVTIEARPERIVSMSATSTEILFAIGAGDQVEAVDSFSNYPAEAPITDLSAFEPNLEAIAAFEPDLVVLSNPNPEIEAGLAAIGVPVMVQGPAVTLDDTYDQVAQLGEATGNLDGAAAVNADIRTGIDEIIAAAPEADQPIRVYHELDETFFSASSASFLGHLYGMLGFENIADAADPDGIGFPQLQVDQIIDGDPTLIVFTDAYEYGADDIAARPGWDALTAVENGNIVEVDADIASRWGPRIVEFLQLVVANTSVPAG